MLAILCSIADPSAPHQRDPAHATDTTPPSATVVTSADVRRFSDSGCMSCGGDRATISIALAATDDATPADQVGYKLTVIGGDPPKGLPASQTVEGGGGELLLYVDPSDKAFSFDLEIRAVDRNGNEGPPVAIMIADDVDAEGCAVAMPTTPMLLVGVLAWLVAKQRR